MNRLLTLSANDFRVVFRDPLLRLFVFAPLLIVALVQWVLPRVLILFPLLQSYEHVILMWACMQTSTMFGFINGFVFLEEKDENIFSALRVMPVAAMTLLAFRMLLGMGISVLVSLLILIFGGLLTVGFGQAVLLALQYALLSPLLALLLAVFAGNKLEGLAQFKMYNILFNLPILIYFLDFRGLHLFALIPTYWSFRSIEAIQQGTSFGAYYSIGCGMYALWLLVLVRIFDRKIY